MPNRFGGANFYYGMYYCSQGMFQLGGDYWPQWAAVMYELLLRNQKRDGSWSLTGPYSDGAVKENAVAATAMAMKAVTAIGPSSRR